MTNQLFICHGAGQRGKVLSKHRLSHWVVDTIKQAYQLSGLPSPVATVAHATLCGFSLKDSPCIITLSSWIIFQPSGVAI